MAPAVAAPASDVGAMSLAVYWEVPYPFATSRTRWEDPYSAALTGPERRLYAGLTPHSGYQVRRLQWTRWGASKVVGKGQARLCDETCGKYRPVKIVLDRKVGISCGDTSSVSQYHYTRYRLYGFRGIANGSRFPAATIC